MKKGIATIIIVIMISIVALFIVFTWQSRLLLAVYRHRSLSDILAADYAAESEVFDLVHRYLKYPNFDMGSNYLRNFGPGQSLQVTATGTSENRTLDFLARWPYASTSFQLTKTNSGEGTVNFDKVEIAMGIDCSPSMNSKACPTCGTSRIYQLQKALSAFIREITNITPVATRDKFYLGLMPFQRTAAWATDSLGQVKPTNDLSRLQNLVDNSGTWNSVSNSPLCRTTGLMDIPGNAGTNLGDSGLILNRTYFTDNVRVKKAYILFTDGLPNTTRTDLACGVTQCSEPEDTGACTIQAVNNLKCSLATTNKDWSGTGIFGTRLPQVDVYAVTVAEQNAYDPSTIKNAYQLTMDVFSNPDYVKQPPFVNANAESLAESFKSIFQSIFTSAFTITFNRTLDPTPTP